MVFFCLEKSRLCCQSQKGRYFRFSIGILAPLTIHPVPPFKSIGQPFAMPTFDDAAAGSTFAKQPLLCLKCSKSRSKFTHPYKNVSSFVLYNIGQLEARVGGSRSTARRNDVSNNMHPYRSQQHQPQHTAGDRDRPFQFQHQRFPRYTVWGTEDW